MEVPMLGKPNKNNVNNNNEFDFNCCINFLLHDESNNTKPSKNKKPTNTNKCMTRLPIIAVGNNTPVINCIKVSA